jgi:predicted nucleic acid-binding Zn ribbon protein
MTRIKQILLAVADGRLKAANVPEAVRKPLIEARDAADALTAKQVWELRIAAGEKLPTWARMQEIQKMKSDAAANVERLLANRLAAGKAVR